MGIVRKDHKVTTRDGVSLRVRTVLNSDIPTRTVIVFVHGVSAPLVPTYDLDCPDYSFLEILANRGYQVVAFDHRNFGESDRSPAMDEEPVEIADGSGIHNLDDSVEDIRTVVEDTRSRLGVDKLVLFGSSRGPIQIMAYAIRYPEGLSMVIANNPSKLCWLSAGRDGEEAEALEAERLRVIQTANYRKYTADFQRFRWKKLFGEGGSVSKELTELYIATCLETDPVCATKTPGYFRVPTEGIPSRKPLIPIEKLTVPLLVVEGEEVDSKALAYFRRHIPPSMFHLVYIRETDHFTLRNARRFELANIIDVAATGLGWARN